MSGAAATPPPALDELRLADDPDRWRALGFDVTDACCQLGSVCLRLLGRGAGRGLLGLSLRGLRSVELDGLVASPSAACPRHPTAARSRRSRRISATAPPERR